MSETVLDNNQENKIKPLYANKNFMLLMIARVVSQSGDIIHYLALTWYILNKIGTGAAVGTIMIFSTLPSVILGPFTGVLADRFDRKKIMVCMDLIRGVMVITLGYMVYLDKANLFMLYGVTCLLAICSSLYFPSSGAMFPNLVHESQLVKANSANSFLGSLVSVLGNAVGGVLLALVGAQWAFIFNGFSYLFAATCEIFLNPPKMKILSKVKENTFFKNLAEGFKFIIKTKALLAMLLFGLTVNFFFFPIQNVILPILVKKDLLLSAREFGLIVACFPFGFLASTFLIQILPMPKKKHKFMIWSMFCQAMGLILLAVPIMPFIIHAIDPRYYTLTYCVIAVIRGLAFGFSNVPMAVVYQTLTPDEYRGRVFALQGTFFQGLQPISMGIAGFVADMVPSFAICIFSGVFMALACIIMLRVKEIKEI